jgi:hypothetical protein
LKFFVIITQKKNKFTDLFNGLMWIGKFGCRIVQDGVKLPLVQLKYSVERKMLSKPHTATP